VSLGQDAIDPVYAVKVSYLLVFVTYLNQSNGALFDYRVPI